MQRFAELFEALDTTTSTNAKVAAMVAYLRTADPQDAAWAVYVLIGRRPKRSVGPALLRRWLSEEAALPDWLVEDAYASVGDLAETIALLVEPDAALVGAAAAASLAEWFEQRILPLRTQDEAGQRKQVTRWWRSLCYRECFLVNKLLTGGLRVGVSRTLVTRALSELLERPRVDVERGLIGEWRPDAQFWHELAAGTGASGLLHPYPFYLASPLERPVQELGAREGWLAEWKWDGIRGQIVRREQECVLWSRGEELITDRFPEIIAAARTLPSGTVLDGEVMCWRGDSPLPFATLQKRIGRKTLGTAILAAAPARFVAYDLLEKGGVDLRAASLHARRAALVDILRDAPPALGISQPLAPDSWEALTLLRDSSRALGVEGVMLKDLHAPYGAGRQRGAWWKWKIEPLSFDAVMIYAAAGHGRRSNLYTDYTFAVWDGDVLVPVAKAYSGLTDEEIRELDRWIRAHTRERFGPVRSVEPVQVFELAYEGIAASPRHKSGIAMRFPRILRWRHDKPAAEADSIADLRQVLAEHGGAAA
ncbi:MAG: ATP-dependent DNA ligase [Steroidobacteraceae bacterium]